MYKYDLVIRVDQGDQLLENKEKKESLEIKQSKFEFFFYPQTIAGDIGRVILGSIILLVIFSAFEPRSDEKCHIICKYSTIYHVLTVLAHCLVPISLHIAVLAH